MRRPDRWAEIESTPLPRNLNDLFRSAVSRHPNKIACHFFEDERTLTYRELGEAVDAMAAALHHLEVHEGSRVGVMLPNVPEFPISWLALAQLGAAIVPLNVRYTASEVDYIATDAEISLLVIDSGLLGTIETTNTYTKLGPERVVGIGAPRTEGCLPLEDLLSDANLPSPPRPDLEPDTLLNIQYTSGTTGFPKGCMLTHRYWVLIGQSAAILADAPKRILADSPFFYMQNQFLFAMAMWGGGQILVPRRMSRSRFMTWVHDHDVDFCWFTDGLLNVPDTPLDRAHRLRNVPADEIAPEFHAQLEDRFGVRVREWYGSTEVGAGTIVPWEAVDKVGSGSIGIPAPFRETKIVDEDLNEVPPGTIGELCVRGPGMMLGYYNKPETNKSLFLEDGWFRTGDLCTRDEDGYHYFVGRAKDMVRRSGENVAAQEVENVLLQVPGVVEAAVVPVPDERRGEEVKAYLVLADGRDPESVPPATVFAWCEERLAPFKVPRYLEYRGELPRTPSAKIAKRLLVDGVSDLRVNSYDRVDGVWR